MLASDPAVRIRYLSFGLFAQKLIDVLMEFVEEGKEERLDAALEEATDFLRALSGEPPSATEARRSRAFHSYEEVRTLDEVCPEPQQRKEIIGLLADLRHRKRPKSARRKNANKAIDFFFSLENRALRNFEQPEPLPRGIRELCRA